MKKILLIAIIFYATIARAQVSKVSLQASGLTCSMCSNAINKALRTIDFVDKVDADIKTSNFEITFIQGKNIDFDKLRKKVEDAGFSVSKFIALVRFNNVQVKAGEPVNVGDKIFRFVNTGNQALNGEKALRIIDKGFVSLKEYKKNTPPFAAEKGAKIYNVTI